MIKENPRYSQPKEPRKTVPCAIFLGFCHTKIIRRPAVTSFMGVATATNIRISAFSGNNYSNIDFAYSFQHYFLSHILCTFEMKFSNFNFYYQDLLLEKPFSYEVSIYFPVITVVIIIISSSQYVRNLFCEWVEHETSLPCYML